MHIGDDENHSLAAICCGLTLTLLLAGCGHTQALNGQPLGGFERQGSRLIVPAGGDLQAAIRAAKPGDTIELAAGATYRGQFVLPAKPGGNAFITILPSDASRVPERNIRIRREDAKYLPKIVFSRGPAVVFQAGAHHYRLRGLEIYSESYLADDLLQVGDPAAPLDKQSHDIELEHLIVHGDALKGSKRGVALHAAGVVIRDSVFYDFKSDFQDAQAIEGHTGPGPYRIVNNYLEASGENIMFGGAAPSIQNLVPAQIEIAHNYFFKPLSWRDKWRVKNLFELKNARGVRIHGNVFENNWAAAQSGFGILFTVRTCEAGNYPWAVVEDVEFSDNILKNSENGINIMSQDDVRADCPGPRRAGETRNIQIRNNFFKPVRQVFMILSGATDITIDHNTALNEHFVIVAAGPPSPGLTFTNNVMACKEYGIFGDSKGDGNSAIQHYFPNGVFRGNVIAGAPADRYPARNFYPPSLPQVFSSFERQDFRLPPNSPFLRKGTDGRDPGVDFEALSKATAGVVEGRIPAGGAEN